MNKPTHDSHLTERTRRRMRKELAAYADLYAAESVRSPYVRRVTRALPALGVSLLAISLTGAGISYASDAALPGDPLYPIKISLVEPAVAAFKNTPEEKEDWHTAVAERRLTEATALAASDRLDEEKRKMLDTAVKTESRRMHALAERYGKEGQSAKELALRSELEARLRAHERVLDELFEQLPENSSAAEQVKELRDSLNAEQERVTEKRRIAEMLIERTGAPPIEAVEAALRDIEASSEIVGRTQEKSGPLQEERLERMERAKKYAEHVRLDMREGRLSGNTYVVAQEGAREAREAAIFSVWGKLITASEPQATSSREFEKVVESKIEIEE